MSGSTALHELSGQPGPNDQKVYAPGIGIVLEQSLTGPSEVAQLVSVNG